jgi:cell division protein FtsB
LHLQKKWVQYTGIAVGNTDEDPEETIMKKRTNPLSNIMLVYRPGKTLTKIALLGVIALSTVALVTIHSAIDKAETAKENLRRQAITMELENQELEHDIAALGSMESILEIAKEELGLVRDLILYQFEN